MQQALIPHYGKVSTGRKTELEHVLIRLGPHALWCNYSGVKTEAKVPNSDHFITRTALNFPPRGDSNSPTTVREADYRTKGKVGWRQERKLLCHNSDWKKPRLFFVLPVPVKPVSSSNSSRRVFTRGPLMLVRREADIVPLCAHFQLSQHHTSWSDLTQSVKLKKKEATHAHGLTQKNLLRCDAIICVLVATSLTALQLQYTHIPVG